MSGTGLHCYWNLDGVVELSDQASRQRFKLLLKRLCIAIGSETSSGAHADSSRADIASVLRVPGTFNHKQQAQPRPVRLVRFAPNADMHTFDWWRANLPAIPLPEVPRIRPAVVTDIGYGERLINWAYKGHPEGQRHKRLTSDAKWLVRKLGIDKNVALDLLLMKAAASPGRTPVTRAEVEGIIKWA